MKDIFAIIGIAFSIAVIICFLFCLILFIKDQLTTRRFTKERQINLLIEMARLEKDIRVRRGILIAIKVLKTGEQIKVLKTGEQQQNAKAPTKLTKGSDEE